MINIVIASKNRKKVDEIRDIFSSLGIDVVIHTLDEFHDIGEIEEDGETFRENAIKKALHVRRATGMITIADDSGLEVEALGGAPGVRSARYSGQDADDRSNNEKLLEQLKDVPDDRRRARFVCCIALVMGDVVETFQGYVYGRIGIVPKGEGGFGYDPLFYPEGHDRTFAEMTEDEKNAISHRAMALRLLAGYLEKNIDKLKGGRSDGY